MNGSRLESCLSFACLCYGFLFALFLRVEKTFRRLSSVWLVLWLLVCEKASSAQSFARSFAARSWAMQVAVRMVLALAGWLVSIWACWPTCPSCLRLVLCRRQPVLWFEHDLRFEYWLKGSYKCSFHVFSSRVGGSAYLVWCFKAPLILWYLHDMVCCPFVSGEQP